MSAAPWTTLIYSEPNTQSVEFAKQAFAELEDATPYFQNFWWDALNNGKAAEQS